MACNCSAAAENAELKLKLQEAEKRWADLTAFVNSFNASSSIVRSRETSEDQDAFQLDEMKVEIDEESPEDFERRLVALATASTSTQSAAASTSTPPATATTQRLQCNVCAKTFMYRTNLANHLRTHTGEGLVNCNHASCGKSFTSSRALSTHVRFSHAAAGARSFECYICKKTFMVGRNLNHHMRIHTGFGLLHCPECDKTFSQTRALSTHVRSHRGPNV